MALRRSHDRLPPSGDWQRPTSTSTSTSTPSGGTPQAATFVPQLWRRVSLGRGAIGRFFLETFVPRNLADGDELRRALITASVASLFTLIAPTYAFLIWLLEEPPTLYYALSAWAFITAAGSLALLRKGLSRASAWFLLIGGGVTVLVPFLLEGAHSQAAGNFVIIVVMAALLVGWKGVVRLGVPVAVLIGIAGWLEWSGLYQPVAVTSSHGVFALMQLISVIVMLVIFDRVRLGLLRAQGELESKLLQSQRLEAIGRLAGGVAHDFNNLLTVILSNVTELATYDQPVTRRDLEDVKLAALRASDLTRQLLAFSRRQKLAPQTFDLTVLLEEERTMLARLLPENIALELDHPVEPVWLHADPGQISQVLLNLAANARDAMPEGGRLRLQLRREPVRSEATHITPIKPRTPSFQIVLRVSDTGTGMDAETMARAFEPFFTTKGPGAGTGLGLATVHGIVIQSGGTVRVASRPGEGTEFIIAFPEATPEEQTGEAAVRITSPRPVSTRHVLLVEDDKQVRGSMARAIGAMGHHVTACGTVAEALACWQAQPTFDLVVSDVVMPESSGPDLLRKMLAATPAARPRVLFVSGYPDDAVTDPLFAGAAFLAKPFTRESLDRKITELLESPAPSYDGGASTPSSGAA